MNSISNEKPRHSFSPKLCVHLAACNPIHFGFHDKVQKQIMDAIRTVKSEKILSPPRHHSRKFSYFVLDKIGPNCILEYYAIVRMNERRKQLEIRSMAFHMANKIVSNSMNLF